MTAPRVGSLWIDTDAKVPAAFDGWIRPLRRVVKVASVDGLFAQIVGFWQEQKPSGAWETRTSRAASAGTASFGRKYQPMEDQ